jgi:hypothetical protein
LIIFSFILYKKNRWNITDIECLSCNESCGYTSAQFSIGNGDYYILECFGPSIPYSILYNRTRKLGKKKDYFTVF